MRGGKNCGCALGSMAVRFEGDVLAGARLNGAFRPGDGLVCVLDNICALYGLRYTMNDREVIIKY